MHCGQSGFHGDDITKLRPSASFGQLTTEENLQVVADGRKNGKQLIDEQLDLFPALKELLTRRPACCLVGNGSSWRSRGH
jgi:urea transport system ATP-binding protein